MSNELNHLSLPQHYRRQAAVIKQNPLTLSCHRVLSLSSNWSNTLGGHNSREIQAFPSSCNGWFSYSTDLTSTVVFLSVRPYGTTDLPVTQDCHSIADSNYEVCSIYSSGSEMNDKAMWDDDTTEVFINAMLDQIYAHERRGMSFSKESWNAIVASFNEKTGMGYDRKQLKNIFDILRKDMKTWDMLLNKTGLGVDPRTKVLDASTDWWREKCQVNRAYSKFLRCPLKFENELKIIFKDVYATGDSSYCPSFRHNQNDDAADGDLYIPTMDEQEGSGDSEDDSFGAQLPQSTGISGDLARIGLSSQSGPSVPTDSGSDGKRKRVDQPLKRKKMKTPVADRIADVVSMMANVNRDR